MFPRRLERELSPKFSHLDQTIQGLRGSTWVGGAERLCSWGPTGEVASGTWWTLYIAWINKVVKHGHLSGPPVWTASSKVGLWSTVYFPKMATVVFPVPPALLELWHSPVERWSLFLLPLKLGRALWQLNRMVQSCSRTTRRASQKRQRAFNWLSHGNRATVLWGSQSYLERPHADIPAQSPS